MVSCSSVPAPAHAASSESWSTVVSARSRQRRGAVAQSQIVIDGGRTRSSGRAGGEHAGSRAVRRRLVGGHQHLAGQRRTRPASCRLSPPAAHARQQPARNDHLMALRRQWSRPACGSTAVIGAPDQQLIDGEHLVDAGSAHVAPQLIVGKQLVDAGKVHAASRSSVFTTMKATLISR